MLISYGFSLVYTINSNDISIVYTAKFRIRYFGAKILEGESYTWRLDDVQEGYSEFEEE